MRFNPPPNWPPPPPGWVPDSGWTPDPSWPPPPPGWQLWVDDSTAQFPPGYPPQQLPYPEQWPPQPARSRKALWIALATAAVVAIVAGVFAVNLSRRATDEKASSRADITMLTPDLLIDRSVFPETGGRWRSGVDGGRGGESKVKNLAIDPPECGEFYGDAKTATQTAAATLSDLHAGSLRSVGVHLFITRERLSVQEYLQICQSFKQSFRMPGQTVTTEVRLDPFDADGVPPWAAAATMTSSSSTSVRAFVSVTAVMIFGYYRGVLIIASDNEIHLRSKTNTPVDTSITTDLVKLLNAQAEKLEAAP